MPWDPYALFCTYSLLNIILNHQGLHRPEWSLARQARFAKYLSQRCEDIFLIILLMVGQTYMMNLLAAEYQVLYIETVVP